MHSYEKLGVFYLGRYHDPVARRTLPDPLLYRSNDLLTHALCVGMTGSGKTGLCFDLIEEAAIDGIPSILIDPKGDLGNLLLTFPDLQPADFEPWINPDEARQRGLSASEFAAQQAETWRKGLAAWDQDGERIRRMRDAADFAIYTPGSNAGLPISILNTFAAPAAEILADSELLRERLQTTVSGLLALIGIDTDPTRSREAIFLANILQAAWQAGRDLDLGSLIQEIQTPSVQRIGVMDVETFFPARDRFPLAAAINGLIASPGFGAWLEGEPLDLPRIFHTPSGKPRVAIFSIAHLNDAERMFFVTLLLNQLLGWMRAQAGTTSLRALLYMDEIFGFFPPVANPPSKAPLLTLLKQGRAFGLGVVLATQNPVDLDYKGLANIGTWFLGRLQTERDKQRVLDGLEGAATAQGSGFDRQAMEQTLAGLGNRVFLLHNVHEDGAAIFESRWALSYLRGPMTRAQIKAVMDPLRASGAGGGNPTATRPSGAPSAARIAAPPAGARPRANLETGAAPDMLEASRPALPPAVPQHFVPVRDLAGPIVYQPRLLGAVTVRFTDAKAGIDVTREIVLLATILDAAVPVDWARAIEAEMDPNDLERQPAAGGRFGPLPPAASQARNYATWQKELIQQLYSTQKVTLFRSIARGQLSRVDEDEGAFRVRLQQAGREERDAAAAKLRAKYAPKIAALNERLRRAEQAVQRESAQATQAKLATVLSIGTTLLGAFLGRKAVTAANLGKAGSALRSVGRASEQAADVARAGETVEAIQAQLTQLDQQFQTEAAAIESSFDPAGEVFATVDVRPAKANISVRLVTLAWTAGQP